MQRRASSACLRQSGATVLAALVLALVQLAATRSAQAEADACSLSCPIGMACDATGTCVSSEHEPSPVHYPVHYGGELEEPTEAGAYEHDGFLARLTLGFAGAAIEERSEMSTLGASGSGAQTVAVDVSGAGLMLGIDIGWALGSSFAWHARLSQIALPSPALSGDVRAGRGETGRTLVLAGPGLSWFAPYGIYAAVAFGVGLTRQAGYDGDTGLGDAGLAANLDLGIEGWVDEQFLLGGVLRAFWSSTGGDAREQRALAFGAALSVTYQ